MKRNVFYAVFTAFMLVCCLLWFEAAPNCVQCRGKMIKTEPLLARMWSTMRGETFLHYGCVGPWMIDNPVEYDENGNIITNLSISE
jgi:hypothetical protein